MASDPKLVVALEARLNKFEKQLKDAGVIAERAVKDVEDKFKKANPAFRGTFIGSFLGTLSGAAIGEISRALADLPRMFKNIDDAAGLAGISVERVFAIGAAAGNIDAVNKSLESMASLLDRARRGEENSLSQLLGANNIDIASIRTVEQLWLRIADLAKNAKNPIQRNEIVAAAGASRELATHLGQGAAALSEQQAAAQKSAPDVAKIIALAKQFDAEWERAIRNFKAAFVSNFGIVQERFGEFILGFVRFLDTIRDAGAGIRRAFGVENVDTGFLSRLEEIGKFLSESGKANQRPVITVTPGGDGSSKPPPLGGNASERDPFGKAANSIEKRIASTNAETAAIDLGTAAREQAKIAAELETVAKQANTAAGINNGQVTAEQAARIAELSARYGEAAVKAEQARGPLASFAREGRNLNMQLQEAVVGGLRGFEDALLSVIDGTKSTKEAFKDMARSIIMDLTRIAIRQSITSPIAGALGFALPGRAAGGPVAANSPYMVGERGPELFVPKTAGNIVPNHVASRGAGGGINVTVQQTISYSTGVTPADMAQIEAMNMRTKAETISETISAIRQGQTNDSSFLSR